MVAVNWMKQMNGMSESSESSESSELTAAGESPETGSMLRTSSLVEQLHSVLEEEYELMKASSAETLVALLQRKESLIVEIAALEPDLVKVFGQAEDDPAVRSLQVRVKDCHELNQRNRTVAHLQLGYTRKSLALLRSLLNLSDVPVYGATGEISIYREKRKLGSA